MFWLSYTARGGITSHPTLSCRYSIPSCTAHYSILISYRLNIEHRGENRRHCKELLHSRMILNSSGCPWGRAFDSLFSLSLSLSHTYMHHEYVLYMYIIYSMFTPDEINWKNIRMWSDIVLRSSLIQPTLLALLLNVLEIFTFITQENALFRLNIVIRQKIMSSLIVLAYYISVYMLQGIRIIILLRLDNFLQRKWVDTSVINMYQ